MDPIEAIKKFENIVTWMYLDTATKPVVTTGGGLALFSVEEAVQVPWDKPEPVVRKDYASVLTAPANYKAAWYRTLTTSRITETYAILIATAKLAQQRIEFLKHVPAYPTFPQSAREALDDLIYNLGPCWPVLKHNGTPEWPHLTAAVMAQDWAKAAKECRRPQLSHERNQYVEDLFLKAAQETR
jgi:hypothetical protein